MTSQRRTGGVILVTGGTGFLGGYVLRSLSDAGYSPKVLVRNGVDAAKLEGLGVDVVYGEMRDKPSLERALGGAIAVVHMAAVVKSNSKQLYYDVNELGTRNLVAACAEKGVNRIVHVSTQDVTFMRGDYALSKMKGEEAVKNSGLEFTIIRPTAIYGRGDCALSGMLNLIRKFPVVPIPYGRDSRIQPVYAGDVATAITKSIGSKNSIGKTYTVAGPDIFTYGELADAIMVGLAVKKPKILMPFWVMKPFVGIYERLSSNHLVTVSSLELMSCDKTCDHSSAAASLGYVPTRFKEGMKDMLRG